jgi:electron transfer flavoprotein alpha subunit
MSGILVVLEHGGGKWNRMSWEALAAAEKLSAQTGQAVSIAALGADFTELSPEAAGRKADRTWLVTHPLLRDYTPDGYITALEQLIRKLDPAYVVFPHTYQVRDYAPGLAARFQTVLVPDVIAIAGEGASPVFVRQLLQGKLNADYRAAGDAACFFSVQAGAFLTDALAPGQSALETFAPQLDPAQIRTQPEAPFRESAQTVDLGTAQVIVSVGRGIKEKENLNIVEDLARALGGELAASRPICDNGWLPMERQVGSSGQNVAPRLYLAVGISGAIQHLVGMKGSKAIAAINKDGDAPIFEVADYGIVGDLFEVVPALTAAIEKLKNA